MLNQRNSPPWMLLKREWEMGNGEWGMRFLTYIDVEMPHLSYTTLTLTVRVKVSSYIKPA